MVTNDKVARRYNPGVDPNVNTRDQNRVGIWFLVVSALMMIGLVAMGGSHAPSEHVTQDHHDMSATGGNAPGAVADGAFDVHRPVGVIEWPGLVGQQTKYLSGKGNTPADAKNIPQQGVSQGVSPNTATDAASRQKATSGSTPSDSMPTQGSPTSQTTEQQPGATPGAAAGGH